MKRTKNHQKKGKDSRVYIYIYMWEYAAWSASIHGPKQAAKASSHFFHGKPEGPWWPTLHLWFVFQNAPLFRRKATNRYLFLLSNNAQNENSSSIIFIVVNHHRALENAAIRHFYRGATPSHPSWELLRRANTSMVQPWYSYYHTVSIELERNTCRRYAWLESGKQADSSLRIH